MKLNTITAFALLLMLTSVPLKAQKNIVEVKSPDKDLTFSIALDGGQAKYTIKRNNKTIIEPSLMGLVVNGKQIGKGDDLKVVMRTKKNKKYATRGVHSMAIDKYNNALIKVNGSNPYALEVRVFNDGAAFRYIIDNNGVANITEDLTEFQIPSNSKVWSQKDISYYENRYEMSYIEDIKEGTPAGPPVVLKLSGSPTYASITEAGLIDFSGMSLVSKGDNIYKSKLSGNAKVSGKIETPWRVILSGDLNQLVNNDIITNLSPEPDKTLFPDGLHTEWIKPGKGVWSWMAQNGPVSFENMKKFTDWGAELGFSYNLVDEGWSHWEQDGKDYWDLMKELVDYSTAKGVGIWAWKAYPDRKGIPGIRNKEDRIAFFEKCSELGIVGLKIDFFDSEEQEIIQFYQDALKDAAKYKLMINFHGSNKPTGEIRTYPNEMTREGVFAIEYGKSWPSHNTALPFTRFLAGHGDFTPLALNYLADGTTLSHQVATVAAFNSPFMCLAVDPEALLKNDVKTFIQNLPDVWDETRVLSGSEIGELVLVAKRSGKEWFLVAINGDDPTTIDVKLDFLEKGSYKTDLLNDIKGEPSKANRTNNPMNRNNTIKIEMPSGGGFVGRFYK